MPIFSEIRATFVVIAAAIFVGLGIRWHLGAVHAAEQKVHAHYAKVLSDISAKTAAAATAFRARENYWQTRFDKEARDGQTRIDTALRDADGARAAADGLRATLARYRAAARAAANPGAAAAGPATGDALDLLSDLFTRADETAGELAQAADLAHAAGITCERSHDALSDPRRPDGGTTESTP